MAWRGVLAARYQSYNAIESKKLPLLLVPGWVTTRVRSSKNLATHTRVCLSIGTTLPYLTNHSS